MGVALRGISPTPKPHNFFNEINGLRGADKPTSLAGRVTRPRKDGTRSAETVLGKFRF
jgi:hypothetical protein